MTKSNRKKKKQLGMPHGTAAARLKKSILFQLVKATGQHYCFQCKKEIMTEEELSVEHKIPWLDSEDPQALFFDLNNIAYSHLKCNVKAARQTKPLKHPSSESYKRGCRCAECKELERVRRADQRKRGIKT